MAVSFASIYTVCTAINGRSVRLYGALFVDIVSALLSLSKMKLNCLSGMTMACLDFLKGKIFDYSQTTLYNKKYIVHIYIVAITYGRVLD